MRRILPAIALIAMTSSAAAQWLHYPDPKIPRTKDGAPDLAAKTPRDGDGKPDLSGVWASEPQLVRGRGSEPNPDPLVADLQFFSRYALNILADFKRGEEPLQPEAAAILRDREAHNGSGSPMSHCLPGGVPFAMMIAPFKIVQTPGLILVLLEDSNPPRQIYTDGRALPDDPSPSWMGYSVGRWDGDMLVVDTIGFNERTWLDTRGSPRSAALHLIERFRRRDVGHLEIAVTIDDPKSYTRPFTITLAERLLADSDVLESVCGENEKDRVHLDR